MRRFCLAVGGLLLLPAWMLAQQPNVDPLTEWEKAMTGLNSVTATVSRHTIKKVFQSVEKYSGEARFLKSTVPNQPCRASLELFKEGRPEVFDKYICTGTHFFTYDSENRVIRWAEQPKSGQGHLGDNFLEFLFGLKAGEARIRYEIVNIPPDNFYYYLKIVPRNEQDKKQFKEARVALNRPGQVPNASKDFLPRQLWLLQSNDDEVTWDFPQLNANALVRATEFGVPETPKGWRMEPIQQQK